MVKRSILQCIAATFAALMNAPTTHIRLRRYGVWLVLCAVVLAAALFVLPDAIITNNTFLAERSLEAGQAFVEEEVKHSCALENLVDRFALPCPERVAEWPNQDVHALPEGARRVHVPPPKQA